MLCGVKLIKSLKILVISTVAALVVIDYGEALGVKAGFLSIPLMILEMVGILLVATLWLKENLTEP